MRFFHLSDLHIGRQLNGYHLRESQEYAFSQIADYVSDKKPDAVLLSGDIYDKSVPAAEAYTVFEGFLNRLKEAGGEIPILVIAGNHDSPERLAYASSFLEKHNIHIAAFPPSREGEFLTKITLSDEWGPVHFYLVPFIRPGYVRPLFEEGIVTGYDSAFRAVLARETIDPSQRNVILAHQFFTSGREEALLCDSETVVLTAGGLDQIDVSALEPFDYAALGHLHGPQKVGTERFRYCGTPYKYSASEEHHKKSVTMVTLREKGEEPVIETLPLRCEPEVRRLRGTLEDVLRCRARVDEEETDETRMDKAAADGGNGALSHPAGVNHDYVSITLTDETEQFDFRERLEERYDHILEIRIDNERTRSRMKAEGELPEVLSPLEAFRSFYEMVRRCPMTEQQEKIMEQIVEEARKEDE